MPKFFNKYYPPSKLIFVIGEVMCILFSIVVATGIRFASSIETVAYDAADWAKILLMAVVCQLCLYYNDLYDLRVTDTYRELGLRLVRAMGVASIILAVIYYLAPSAMLGSGIFFISIAFLILFVCSWRYLYSWILKRRMFAETLMIVGSGELAQRIVGEIGARKDSGYRIAALMDNPAPSAPQTFSGYPIVPSFQAVHEAALRFGVRKIVAALEERRGKLPIEELLRCKMDGIRVLDGVSFYEELAGKILVEKLNPSWLIFSEGFKKSRLTRLSKRLSGGLISLIGLLLSLPLILLTALCIKLESRGPVFYSQRRCGEKGEPFNLHKFRSMIAEAENGTGAVWAEKDDPRITRVGRIIRKLRIDEIPQMWNVLKGDMSFVGPRPERPEFVEELAKVIPFYKERLNVKPGITGWAQVSYSYGASVADAKEKLEYDLFYIKNMNFLFDLLIMFQTIKIVLLGRGSR